MISKIFGAKKKHMQRVLALHVVKTFQDFLVFIDLKITE